MTARELDPRRLDVRALANAAAELAGEWPLASFTRLNDVLAMPDATRSGTEGPPVRWSACGAEIPVLGSAAQVWLHLRAEAELPLICQRCLKPFQQAQTLARQYLFAANESEAASLDEVDDHDVLVLSRELDLHELLEDELLLDLPLVPRHDVCPDPLPASTSEAAEPVAENPFAALAALRRGSI